MINNFTLNKIILNSLRKLLIKIDKFKYLGLILFSLFSMLINLFKMISKLSFKRLNFIDVETFETNLGKKIIKNL